ncbi:MAG: NUDIX domain-containing protein, partial [Pseudomonadota bacterium]
RPESGLLGGMLGWPGGAWSEAPEPCVDPPLEANWTAVAGEVRHTFTHFHLRLSLMLADVELDAEPLRGAFVPKEAFRPSDLPTVMRKAFDLAVKGRDSL